MDGWPKCVSCVARSVGLVTLDKSQDAEAEDPNDWRASCRQFNGPLVCNGWSSCFIWQARADWKSKLRPSHNGGSSFVVFQTLISVFIFTHTFILQWPSDSKHNTVNWSVATWVDTIGLLSFATSSSPSHHPHTGSVHSDCPINTSVPK